MKNRFSYSLKNLFRLFSAENFIFISIVLFVILVPNSILLSSYFSYDAQRIIEVFIIFINLFILLISKNLRSSLSSRFYLFSRKTKICLTILLLLAITSSIFAKLTQSAILEISLFLGLMILSMTVSCVFFKYKLLFSNIITLALISSAVIYQTTFFVFYLYAMIHKISFSWPFPITGFDNVRFFNQYQIWTFFLISYPLLHFKNLNFWLSNSLKLITIGWSVLLFYSNSRGAIIAIFLGLLIAYIFFRKQATNFLKLNVYILCAGTIATWILFKLLPLIFVSEVTTGWRTLEQLTIDNVRIYLWQRALSFIKESPWLGVGPMHYAYYPDPLVSHESKLAFSGAHNLLLQWASEMGLPSAIILVIFIVRGLLLWVNRFNETIQRGAIIGEEVSLNMILFTTMCTAILYSLVDGVNTPVSEVLMATLLGWMLGFYFQDCPKGKTKTSLSVLIFAGTVLIMLTYTIMPGLIPRLAGEKDFSTHKHSEVKYPRFWVQGNIPD